MIQNESYSKPSGLGSEYGAQFQDEAIVRAYHHREPYSPALVPLLQRLAASPSPSVLDLGCGTGDLTQFLSLFARTVHAVDPSAPMIAAAKRRNLPNVEWVIAPAESCSLERPFVLITAADSFHWMDWPVMAQRIRAWLRPGAYLALVSREYVEPSWWTADLQAIIDRYSTNRNFQPYDLVKELTKSGLFRVVGEERTEAIPFTQTVAELVESFHSRNGFSRERMSAEAAAGFDREAAEHFSRFVVEGKMHLEARSRVTWLTPTLPDDSLLLR
jgi:SAM-dependent methyltransferase